MHRIRNLLRVLLQLATFALLAAAVVLGVGAFRGYFTWLPDNKLVGLILLTAILFLAAYLFRLSKQLALVALPKSITDDKRDPVLYLRTFSDDDFSQWGDFGEAGFLGVFTTQEERLVAVLKKLGPVVALGIPDEKLPGVGAVREYVSYGVWQQHVQNYMNKAVLVVIRIGAQPTQNLLWEFKEALRLASERLVLLVPRPHEYESFRKLADEAGAPLPAYPETALRPLTMAEKVAYGVIGGPLSDVVKSMPRWADPAWDLSGIVYFERDGAPTFQPFAIPKGRRRNISTALGYAMRLIFEQHGLEAYKGSVDLGKIVKRIANWCFWLFLLGVVIAAFVLSR